MKRDGEKFKTPLFHGVKEASSLVFFSGLLILTGISRCRDAGFAIRYLNC